MAKPFPMSASLQKIIDVITTTEAAEYFDNEFNKMTSQAGIQDKIQTMVQEIKQFKEFVEAKDPDRWNPWSGKNLLPPSVEQHFQDRILKHAVKLLANKDIMFEYAVSDDLNFLRAYSSDGLPFDDAANDALDQFFNVWLKENGKVIKEGVIYQATEAGEIKKDAAGNDLKADVDDLKGLLESPDFEQKVRNYDDSISVTPIARDYPEEAPIPATEQAAQEAATQQKPG